MRIFKRISMIMVAALATLITTAQVTTSSISGVVKTADGQPIEGASLVAVHTPSGSQYSTLAKKGGVFTLPGLRTGGPYTLKITFAGLKVETVNDIYLLLGEPYVINPTLIDESKVLSEVVVNALKKKSSGDKSGGASTVINQRMLSTMPTISRSINDFTRVTPQANGTSFAGRDGRFNNTQVDGANLNNNFGLSSNPLPGGGASPISIDAIEEVSVNIAPFDVRQSGFTGAGINAVTKSGTNNLKGTIYGLYRNQDYNGTNVGDVKLPALVKSSNKIFGATLGGAIIKNKLFYFASYEEEELSQPGITFSPRGGSGAGNVSNTSVDSLNKFANHLRTAYGYDPGAFDNFPNFTFKNTKILAKIDWNINNTHKLTLKYSDLVNNNDQPVNGSSIPNGPSFRPVGASGTINRLPNNRFSLNSMAFANSNYKFKDVVRTGSLELNSNFSGKFSNQFIATFSKIQATRAVTGGIFPTIDIFNNNGQNYMSAGSDPFTRNNDVNNEVFNVTNNFTYYAGKHTLTAGVNYEYQSVGNMFMPGSASYYAFNSLDDFINNRAPAAFSYTFSLDPSKPSVYAADLKVGQLGIYAQDEFNVNENFKLTYGIRIDKVLYPEAPLENPNVSALSFPDRNGVPTNFKTSEWPSQKTLYFSPRVGFRYKIDEENIVIRGGTGLFTGRIPFVYLTNMPGNSQMYQASQAVTNPALLGNFLFNPNPDAYRGSFSPVAGVLPNNANIVMMDKEFRFPQIWRTNIAFDKKLGNGWGLTVEALLTKDINAVIMRNANQRNTNAVIANGDDTRGRFANTADRRLYSNIGSAIILENASRGNSGSFTVQLTKTTQSGFFGMIAYTKSYANELTANPGSQATSTWQSNPTTGTQNDQQLFNSAFVNPDRIITSLSYKFSYGKNLATTFSLFGEIARGNNYSYTYNGDINNDGNSSADLMHITYVPNFVPLAAGGGNPARSVAEQTAAWQQFVQNTPYLRKNIGKYAGRNETYLPWVSRFDLRVVQDIFTNIGNRKHTLQVTADIFNFGNMLFKSSGVRQIVTTAQPLIFRGYDAQGRPTFNLQQQRGQLVTKPWQDNLSLASTWSMQLGVRYIF
jgi:outer membrane receptor protein involved in Fe transport